MKLCSDTACGTVIPKAEWTTTQGSCSPCSGSCSYFNPSSVTSTTGITFYSDSVCSVSAVIGTEIPIIFDGKCHATAMGTPFGSYSATPGLGGGAIAGIIVGTLVGVALIVVGIVFCCRARGVNCCACCCPPLPQKTLIVQPGMPQGVAPGQIQMVQYYASPSMQQH